MVVQFGFCHDGFISPDGGIKREIRKLSHPPHAPAVQVRGDSLPGPTASLTLLGTSYRLRDYHSQA